MEGGEPINILLVDDNPVLLEMLGFLLSDLGHRVIPFDGGLQAIAYLETGEPVDLVLTDLRMPHPDGRQVVQRTKAREPSLPVGIITGSPELLYDHPEPADFILPKPIDFDALEHTLGCIAERRALTPGSQR